MPRHLPTYSTCAAPGTARPHTNIGGLAGFIISAWYFSGVLTIVGGLAFLFGIVWLAGPMGWCIIAAAIIIALVEIKHWYYNERLLCIADRDCAIGTVISEPTAAFDGDRKLDLMLAPFTQLETEIALINHLEQNRAMLEDPANFGAPFHSGVPFLPASTVLSSNRSELVAYMDRLAGSDPDDSEATSNMYNQTTIGLVDTLMQTTTNAGEPRNFFLRFYRKLVAAIPDQATRDAIPEDFDPAVNWQAPGAQSTLTSVNPYTNESTLLNPMFRYAQGSKPLVPYLHCELEGNYIEILLNDFILALTVFVAGCVALGFLGPLGPLAALALAILVFLIKKLIDWITGNDGDASTPDIDWDDPDFTGYPGFTERSGDVVVAYGNWIMDTEHHQYFEIHPVRAYYIIAQRDPGVDTPPLVNGNEDQILVGPNFDPQQVTGAMAGRICELVSRAEQQDPASTVPVTGAAALSFGMRTHYS